MAPHDLRRPFKRPAISDQQKRRELSLERQSQNRSDAQHQARRLASTLLSLPNPNSEPQEVELQDIEEIEPDYGASDLDIRQAAKLRGAEARRWFARQLMLPEWMIDVPDRLYHDWYVMARPAGKRCFVVSSNGTTVSRVRNGSLLHRFPSALPNGAKTRESCRSGQSYCILDCIFHEMDQTYYVIDMVCWAGISFFECTAEFRFFWLNNKLVESGACDTPSVHHKYRFSMVPVYNCDHESLNIAYMGSVPYVKDGLLFYNKIKTSQLMVSLVILFCIDHYIIICWQQACFHSTGLVSHSLPYVSSSCFTIYFDFLLIQFPLLPFVRHAHYQAGNTPLALVWKDENCSQYVIDTDGNGQVPSQQQVALELQDDGKLITSDDPPIILGSMNGDFIQKWKLHSGDLVRFAVNEGGLIFVEGKLEKADLHYIGKVNRARAFADSYSKIMFQYMVRHSPLRIEHLLASLCSANEEESRTGDMEMVG